MPDEFIGLLLNRFDDRLRLLEVERMKLVQERKAYLFSLALILSLGVCCVLSAAIGHSRVLAGLGVLLLLGGEALRRLREGLGETYQTHFRERVTREWFHLQYPGAYLAPALSSPLGSNKVIPPEIQSALREVCVRATAQNPSLTSIEEKILFDTDTHQSWKLVLKERNLVLGGVKSRAVVWIRLSAVENRFVAYAWPSMNKISRAPEIRFFNDGQVIESAEPLRSRLSDLYELIRSRSAGGATRVALSPLGIWAGVRVAGLPFTAPVDLSCLDPAAYSDWRGDAQLLVDAAVTSAMTQF